MPLNSATGPMLYKMDPLTTVLNILIKHWLIDCCGTTYFTVHLLCDFLSISLLLNDGFFFVFFSTALSQLSGPFRSLPSPICRTFVVLLGFHSPHLSPVVCRQPVLFRCCSTTCAGTRTSRSFWPLSCASTCRTRASPSQPCIWPSSSTWPPPLKSRWGRINVFSMMLSFSSCLR